MLRNDSNGSEFENAEFNYTNRSAPWQTSGGTPCASMAFPLKAWAGLIAFGAQRSPPPRKG